MTSDTTPLSPLRKGIAGVQYLFVAFGATVLVPLLVGLDPSTALFSAGIGTLLFHLATKGKVPIFLGSSFAFIAPIISATQLYGLSGALFGCIGVSAVYLVMSLLIRLFGLRFISRLFPPVVIGPIIMLIGLSLSGAAVKMATTNWPLATISLATAIIVTLYGRGIAKLIPIFLGIIVGYLADLLFFEVDLKPIAEAAWWSLPQITVIEHIGDVYVVHSVAGKNFVKEPGLHRTMLGDGIACLFASLVGGPPVTTYSEVTGAMSLTKITDPVVFRIAAVTGVLFSLIGKVSALLRSIDQAILGGIMLLLFGTIAGAGITSLLLPLWHRALGCHRRSTEPAPPRTKGGSPGQPNATLIHPSYYLCDISIVSLLSSCSLPSEHRLKTSSFTTTLASSSTARSKLLAPHSPPPWSSSAPTAGGIPSSS